MEEYENVLTDEEAQRLVEWVMGQGLSEQKAYEALAYTMGVKSEIKKPTTQEDAYKDME